MPKADLWNNRLSRVELDQRAREGRLQLERAERLFVPLVAARHFWLRRGLFHRLVSFGVLMRNRRTRRTDRQSRGSATPIARGLGARGDRSRTGQGGIGSRQYRMTKWRSRMEQVQRCRGTRWSSLAQNPFDLIGSDPVDRRDFRNRHAVFQPCADPR